MSETGRAVTCPSCSTGYFLPAELIGPRGARVRCPKCGTSFVVEANEAGAAGAPPAGVVEGPAADAGRGGGGEGAADTAPAGPAEHVRETPAGPADDAGRARPEPPAAHHAARLADAALDAVAERSGEAIARAAAEGTLFAEHGREIMAAFDEWRREAGRDADPAVFRAALRARWGVDLA